MALTYPITLPANPKPAAQTLRLSAVVALAASPFTLQQQVYRHQGEMWEAELELPRMLRADAEEWIGALLALGGRFGTFLLGDYAGTVARGVATGTPLVNGAGQTGLTLNTDGWTNSTTNILRRGDYIQIGTGATARLYKVMQDANSGATTGPATLEIRPRLRESPADNAAILVTNTVGLFRLAANDLEWDVNTALHYGLRFNAMEAF